MREKKKWQIEPLKNKGSMSLNFYLSDYNTVIEYQGIQHYKATIGIFMEEKVGLTKEMDKLKCQLCKDRGILIHYVKYNENVSENIES